MRRCIASNWNWRIGCVKAVEKLGGHKPAGPFRGGKYSNFDGGTRVPFIVRWAGRVKPDSQSSALISQVNLLSSLAALNTNTELGNAPKPQLYNLARDPGEKNDLADRQPETVAAMIRQLNQIRASRRTRQ
jgi:hypothetical protein